MLSETVFERLGGVRPAVGDGLSPMSKEEIKSVESFIDARLPLLYREFLATFGACTFNGTSPDNPHLVFRSSTGFPEHVSDDDCGLFDAFYGAKQDEHDPYSLAVRIRFFMHRMPKSIIPIGDDGGAGQICIGIHGNELGKVYYWDQANEPLGEEDYLDDFGVPRPEEAMFDNVYLIAESFEDFIKRLEPMDA